MTKPVDVRLSPDQALVLFEVLARFRQTDQLRIKNNAEFIAVSEVRAQLEETLVELFSPDYGQLLAEAQQRLADGYEGLAPGVEP
jgi:hypothetical protein